MSSVWRAHADGQPVTVPEALQQLVDQVPANHPLQDPALWTARAGAVVSQLGDGDSWVYGVVRRRVVLPLGRGPGLTLPVFIPPGNQFAGYPPASVGPNTIEDLLDALPALPARAVLFEELDLDSPVASAVATACAGSSRVRSTWLRPGVRAWLLKFPEDRARYWDKFSSKSRNTLQRKARKLSGPLVTYRSVQDVEPFLRAAQQVSERSWQHRDIGIRISADSRAVDFERRLAGTGQMLSFVLWHEEKPVAFMKGYLIGSVLFYDEGGYDESAASLSPGLALWVGILQQLIAVDTGISTIDFGFGDAGFKAQLGTDITMRSHLMVHRPAWILSLALRAASMSAKIRDAAIARRNRASKSDAP